MLGKSYLKQSLHLLWMLGFVYFFGLMLNITLEYIPFSREASFLMIKQTEVYTHKEYVYIFYTHVYTSIFVLIAGFFALYKNAFPKSWHKIFGYIYVFGILIFAAPSGGYMGIHANGGWVGITSFLLLSILWWLFTYFALTSILKKNIKQHRHWMWRSYALTLSAITLRAWKVILVYLFQPAPMDLYQIIAWLGWLPNLIFIELYIQNKKQ